jgi:hypothetical protein
VDLLSLPRSGGGLFSEKLPLGGASITEAKQPAEKGVPIIAVTLGTDKALTRLLEQNPAPKITNMKPTEGFAVFYRELDYSATAFFYLDSPSHDLPELPKKEARIAGLLAKYDKSNRECPVPYRLMTGRFSDISRTGNQLLQFCLRFRTGPDSVLLLTFSHC